MSSPQLELAKVIVREFAELSYNAASWEKLVANRNVSPYGCLIDVLGIECPEERRKEAAHAGAMALRAAFPEYTRSATNWQRKFLSDADVVRIIQVVSDSVSAKLRATPSAAPPTSGAPVASPARQPAAELQLPVNFSFVDWRPFLAREPVPHCEGVYLFCYSEALPSTRVDPLDDSMIYIGITEGQTLDQRLQQFQDTALGKTGHSGGWSYRLEMFPDDYHKLQSFFGTFVSWLEVPSGSPQTPRSIESLLLRVYRAKWGTWPKLNKKG